MNPDQLKSSLYAAKPWPFHLLKQSSALNELAASADTRAAGILAEAVDAKHRLAGKMIPILAATTQSAWIDALCGIWVKQRQDWLGEMIRANRWTGGAGGVSLLCALRAGLQDRIDIDPTTMAGVLGLLEDKNHEVRAGVATYASRLPNDGPSNDAIYAALVKTKSADLARLVKEQNRVPGQVNERTAWWVLKSGLHAGLPVTAQVVTTTALELVVDKDDQVSADAIAYARRLPDDSPSNDSCYAVLVKTKSKVLAEVVKEQRRLPGQVNEQVAWWVLKCGLQAGLPVTAQVVATVLQLTDDKDTEVQAGVVAYASRLPDDAPSNDALHDAWIRTQSTGIQEVLIGQKRLPSSVAKETLLRLSAGDVEGYLALDDENGQIFREAWGLAPESLRQLIVRTVTQSGNSRLIDAYTRALGSSGESGGGADAKITLEARKTAGDEDGLLEACRPLQILDLLDQCARWVETGRLPTDPSRKRAVENAIAAWREVGEIEFEGAPELPDGLVDFFEAELESSLDSPDPLMRLHAAVNGKGQPDPQKLIKSDAWPDRLAARLLDPAFASTEDHVEWTSLVGGIISNAIFATTAEGTPAEHETLLRLREDNADRNDRAAVLNRSLAGVLLAFQSHFQRGAIASLADDSADDRAAIQVGGQADAGDMEF